MTTESSKFLEVSLRIYHLDTLYVDEKRTSMTDQKPPMIPSKIENTAVMGSWALVTYVHTLMSHASK